MTLADFLESKTVNWVMGILGGIVGMFVALKIIVPGVKYP